MSDGWLYGWQGWPAKGYYWHGAFHPVPARKVYWYGVFREDCFAIGHDFYMVETRWQAFRRWMRYLW